ncbi:unnamed protein product [Rotaria sordida]|uniref:RING-type domain-containing protein n=1 Tax=Rotaria sordida TaxID=392033 RepID=A0A815R607_9BILA|nr:unnamed protein product [Rotaria sordida]
MSRRISDDSYQPSRRRVTLQSHQPSDSSFRRQVPLASRDFASQSTFQSHQQRNIASLPSHSSHRYHGEYSHSNGYSNLTRSSTNRMNNVYDNQSDRRYRLEPPSTRSPVRHSPSYHADHQDLSHSSNRHYFNSQQPSTDYYSTSQLYHHDQNYPIYARNSDQYDRRHHREETHPSQSYPLHSHRSVDIPLEHQHSNPVQSFDHPSSFLHNLPIDRSSDPTSILNHVLQTFFGELRSPFRNADLDHSTLDPMSLFAAALVTGRPDVFTAPGALHIHFGDLFDLLPRDEPPSVGLCDNDIERLPTMTYRKTSKSSSTDEKCAICLSEYKTGEIVKRLRCKHFFHPECINPWLKTSTQCPICRAQQTD